MRAYKDSYLDENSGDVPAGMDIWGNHDQPDYSNLSQESLVEMRHLWSEELKQIDEEIGTLRQVLASKYRRKHFLKRQIGITAVGEFKEEVKQGLDNLRASEAYQRTSIVLKNAKDKTTAVIQEKWNLLKHSTAIKSIENKVESAYSSVLGKLNRPIDEVRVNNGKFTKQDEVNGLPLSDGSEVLKIEGSEGLPVEKDNEIESKTTSFNLNSVKREGAE